MDTSPPYEGYLPVINGCSFDVMAFYSGLTKAEIKDWTRGKAKYGIYVERSISVLMLDLGKAWTQDVYLNILHEDQGTRKPFFQGDSKHTKMHLILASYPEAVVRGIRIVAIEQGKMRVIKEACLTQLTTYDSVQTCNEVAHSILDKFSSELLRKMAKKG